MGHAPRTPYAPPAIYSSPTPSSTLSAGPVATPKTPRHRHRRPPPNGHSPADPPQWPSPPDKNPYASPAVQSKRPFATAPRRKKSCSFTLPWARPSVNPVQSRRRPTFSYFCDCHYIAAFAHKLRLYASFLLGVTLARQQPVPDDLPRRSPQCEAASRHRYGPDNIGNRPRQNATGRTFGPRCLQ